MSVTTVNSSVAATRPTLIFEDLAAGMRMSQVWRAFAWDEMQNRYRRSVLGLLWIAAAYFIFVIGVGFFFTGFSASSTSFFITYVALGYAAFQFLMGNITDGCQVFTSSSSWIKSAALPYSIYVYKSVFRSLLTFGLQLAMALAIIMFLGWRPTWHALLAIPALGLYILDAVALQYLFGLVAARFRDVIHLVGAITRLLIFVTPIIWVREERGGAVGVIADFNPLTHLVEIFRHPLMGFEPRSLSWAVALALSALIWLAAAVAAARMKRRLPFWV
ncbi:MAG: ABC transporter permease [Amphiplicatus sp.]